MNKDNINTIIKTTNIDIIDGVYKHNAPNNVELYDKMWNSMNTNQCNGVEAWGNDRIMKLFRLFGQKVNFSGKNVLDACCGLGRLTIASLELNAKEVYAIDGSFSGLKAILNRINNKQIPYDHNALIAPNNISSKNIFPIQGDAESICDIFNKNSFDIIIHHMALHHMRDYKKTLDDLVKLLKPNGVLTFNFFTSGESPQLAFDLREIFTSRNLEYVYEFLEKIGKIRGKESKKVCDLKELIYSDKKIDEKFDDVLSLIKDLTKKYDIEDIDNRMSLEDFQTPYLHNFDHNEIREYIVKNLNLAIIYEHRGNICAQLRI